MVLCSVSNVYVQVSRILGCLTTINSKDQQSMKLMKKQMKKLRSVNPMGLEIVLVGSGIKGIGNACNMGKFLSVRLTFAIVIMMLFLAAYVRIIRNKILKRLMFKFKV